jgi:hypothetical protein
VSTTQTILLGAIAGFTIYLGLPLGRVRVGSVTAKAFLNATSAGILLFLLLEILGHATEPPAASPPQQPDPDWHLNHPDTHDRHRR